MPAWDAMTSTDSADYFLPRRFAWMRRTLGVPVCPTTGDLTPVKDTLLDIVDAAGGLEYSRMQLKRMIKIAQAEFEQQVSQACRASLTHGWGGANTPAVYFEFCNAVAWTRGVADRFEKKLCPAVKKHDADLLRELGKVRSRTVTGREFDEAHRLAACSLHHFVPPFSQAGAQVNGGTLIYPIPQIKNQGDFRANKLIAGRHAEVLVDNFWAATEKFVDGLLDVFYPAQAAEMADERSG